MADTNLTKLDIYEKTLSTMNTSTMDNNAQYIIKDMPLGGITNAQMLLALDSNKQGIFLVGSVYMCTDTVSGQYTANHFYKLTDQNTWVDVTPTVDLSAYATTTYVDTLYEGAQKALAYTNYSAMITTFNALASDVYKVGQNVYVQTLNVPDLWVYSVEASSSTYTYIDDATFVNDLLTNGYVQVGYYRLAYLETNKVDLTNYVTTNTAQTITAQKTFDNQVTFTNSSAQGTNSLSIKNDNGYNAKIKMGSAENIRLMTSGTYFGTAIGPISDNTYDLGESNAKWKNLYLAGSLSDGTNTVAVANIAKTSQLVTIEDV